MSNYGTPYDDSFRTLLTDCKRLIVPLVNEMFGENWQETENVELYQNEVFITTGADEKANHRFKFLQSVTQDGITLNVKVA